VAHEKIFGLVAVGAQLADERLIRMVLVDVAREAGFCAIRLLAMATMKVLWMLLSLMSI